MQAIVCVAGVGEIEFVTIGLLEIVLVSILLPLLIVLVIEDGPAIAVALGPPHPVT